MIDVDIAQTFLKVAQTRSFRFAARELNVTQSTVSARIRTLEDRLGLKVFDRTRTGARLNKHGRAFERYAAAIVHAWDEGRRAAALGVDHRDRLAIGGERNLWTRLLALWLLEMRAQFPTTLISAHAVDAEPLVESLLDSKGDIAVMHIAPEHSSLEVQRLMDDELVLVTTDPGGAYADRYIDIEWPMDAPARAQREALTIPTRTTIGLGFASVNFLVLSRGAGFLPRRLVEPYIAMDRLYLTTDTPTFHAPVYVVNRVGVSSPINEQARAMLGDIAALATKGELPPPFWNQAT